MTNVSCSNQLHRVLGKHACMQTSRTHNGTLTISTRLRVTHIHPLWVTLIHHSLYGWRLLISTLFGWRMFISTLLGWRILYPTSLGDAFHFHPSWVTNKFCLRNLWPCMGAARGIRAKIAVVGSRSIYPFHTSPSLSRRRPRRPSWLPLHFSTASVLVFLEIQMSLAMVKVPGSLPTTQVEGWRGGEESIANYCVLSVWGINPLTAVKNVWAITGCYKIANNFSAWIFCGKPPHFRKEQNTCQKLVYRWWPKSELMLNKNMSTNQEAKRPASTPSSINSPPRHPSTCVVGKEPGTFTMARDIWISRKTRTLAVLKCKGSHEGLLGLRLESDGDVWKG